MAYCKTRIQQINSLSNIIYITRKEDKFMVVKVRILVMLTDKQKLRNVRTNKWNNTKFERNLAMMMIYVPIKNDFDQTNRF